MTTIEKQNDLQARKNAVAEGGGKDAAAKQKSAGKLLARERISKLLDEGSFVELNALMGDNGEGVVTGHGTIDGRLAYVYAQDFTVMSGAVSKLHAEKICKVMDMALKTGAPIISILDSNGARISDGVEVLAGFGEIFKKNAQCSGVIPQISVVVGPCAGSAVFSPAMSDLVFYVTKSGKMFVNGPEVIESATGKKGCVCPCENGAAHLTFENEDDCLAAVRGVFGYLPSNNLCECDCVVADDINRVSVALNSIVPDDSNAAYDVKGVITAVADAGSFIELQDNWAKNIVVGLARMNGTTVGVVANQPAVDNGQLDINACEKAARMVNFCDSFNIPVVTFTDVPGFKVCACEEKNGIARHGATLIYAYASATVPKINVILRKAYGGASVVMSSKQLGTDAVFAWPTAEVAVMGVEGAAGIMYNDELASSKDPEKTRAELVEKYKEEYASPYIAAKIGNVDDVIEPHNTRPMIIASLEALATKRESLPAKKHGNMPL